MQQVDAAIINYARRHKSSSRELNVPVYEFDTTYSVQDRIEAMYGIPKGFCISIKSDIIPFGTTERNIEVVDMTTFFLDVNQFDSSLIDEEILAKFGGRSPDITNLKQLMVLLFVICILSKSEITADTIKFIRNNKKDILANFRRVCGERNIDPTDVSITLSELTEYLTRWYITEYRSGSKADVFTLIEIRRHGMESIIESIRTSPGSSSSSTSSSSSSSSSGVANRTEAFTPKHVEYLSEVQFPVGTRLLEIFDAMDVTDDVPYARVVYQNKSYHKIKSDMLHKDLASRAMAIGDGIYFRSDIGRVPESPMTVEGEESANCGDAVLHLKRVYSKSTLLRDEYNTKISIRVNPLYMTTAQTIGAMAGHIDRSLAMVFGKRVRMDHLSPTRQSGVSGCVIYDKIRFDNTLFTYCLLSTDWMRYLFFLRDFGDGSQRTNTISNTGKRLIISYEPDHGYDGAVTNTRIVIKQSKNHPTQVSVNIKSDLTLDQIGGLVRVIDSAFALYSSRMTEIESNIVADYAYRTPFGFPEIVKTKRESVKSGVTLDRLQTNRPLLFGGKVTEMTCKGSNKLASGKFYSAKCQACRGRQPWLLMSRAELNAFLDANAVDLNGNRTKSPVFKQKLFYEGVLPFPKNGDPEVRNSIPDGLLYNDDRFDDLVDWYVCPKYTKAKNIKTHANGVVVSNNTKFPNDSLTNNMPGGFPLTFPCCFSKSTQNKRMFKQPPRIILTPAELKKTMPTLTPKERESIVKFPKVEGGDTASDKGVYWYIHPESSPQSSSGASSSSSSQYTLGRKKMLSENVTGKLPLAIEKVFDVESGPMEFTRAGVKRSPSSFFRAVYSAYHNIDPHISYNAFKTRIVDAVKDEGLLVQTAQSTFDRSPKDLSKMASDEDVYKDPRLWCSILEAVFKINIFIFKMDQNTPDGDVVAPRASSFYVARELWYPRSIVIVMDAMDDIPYPYQCEYVYSNIPKVNRSLARTVFVYETVGNFDYRLVVDRLIKYLLLKTTGICIPHTSEFARMPHPTPSPTPSHPPAPSSSIQVIELNENDDDKPSTRSNIDFSQFNEDDRQPDVFESLLDEHEIDENDVIFTSTMPDKMRFTRYEIVDRLINSAWLNDNIINHSLEGTPIPEGMIITTTLQGGSGQTLRSFINTDASLDEIKRRLGMRTPGKDWTSPDIKRILVPFNITVPTGHWVLLDIRKPDDGNTVFKIYYYDSLLPGGVGKGIREEYKHLLHKLFNIPESDVKFVVMKSIPQQEDANNCGMFMLLFASDLLHDRRITKGRYDKIDMDNERWKLAIRILQDKIPLT